VAQGRERILNRSMAELGLAVEATKPWRPTPRPSPPSTEERPADDEVAVASRAGKVRRCRARRACRSTREWLCIARRSALREAPPRGVRRCDWEL